MRGRWQNTPPKLKKNQYYWFYDSAENLFDGSIQMSSGLSRSDLQLPLRFWSIPITAPSGKPKAPNDALFEYVAGSESRRCQALTLKGKQKKSLCGAKGFRLFGSKWYCKRHDPQQRWARGQKSKHSAAHQTALWILRIVRMQRDALPLVDPCEDVLDNVTNLTRNELHRMMEKEKIPCSHFPLAKKATE